MSEEPRKKINLFCTGCKVAFKSKSDEPACPKCHTNRRLTEMVLG